MKLTRSQADDAQRILDSTSWAALSKGFDEEIVEMLATCKDEEQAWKLTCMIKASRMYAVELRRMANYTDLEEQQNEIRDNVS